ncbi:unnamed protein product, partial [Musa textilis]
DTLPIRSKPRRKPSDFLYRLIASRSLSGQRPSSAARASWAAFASASRKASFTAKSEASFVRRRFSNFSVRRSFCKLACDADVASSSTVRRDTSAPISTA